MSERYPIGETASLAVAVIRHEAEGYGAFSVALHTGGGEATVHVPGHYPGVLAQRLLQADSRFAPGAKLPAGRDGADDAHQAYGPQPRFWVEPERRDEFRRVSDARRAAWAWRRYVEAVRAVDDERILEVRYEDLPAAGPRLATFLDLDPAPLDAALAAAHTESVGRWRRDLTAEQVADVEAEAGALLP
jgi:hypothetical protein